MGAVNGAMLEVDEWFESGRASRRRQTACKKTGEGEYQVEKPVVGTTTDTVHTPTVDVTKDTVSATVPKVEINKPDTTT